MVNFIPDNIKIFLLKLVKIIGYLKDIENIRIIYMYLREEYFLYKIGWNFTPQCRKYCINLLYKSIVYNKQ